MDDINEFMNYEIQHTYLVLRKMELDRNSLLSHELLNCSDINSEIRRIYEYGFKNSSVLKPYRYGLFGSPLVGDYILRTINYKGFKLLFVVSPLTIVLANYISLTNDFSKNESSCIEGINKNLYRDFIRKITYEGYEYNFINTYEPFYDFCQENCNGVLSIQNNDMFWNDFYHYLLLEPRKGVYNLIQLDSLIIVYKYKRKEQNTPFIYNHGIVKPTIKNLM
ncbi:hypothetical protein [Fictibacillus halophilus]|uniref:hypothetical protein n=1 Tax=Fictibacillus halophilus TaxID=1610490 RepID=UPI001CFA522C|nr:hypothetical protein [Fictibacillus halophilus]